MTNFENTDVEFLYNLFLKSTGVCTDTRKLEKDNLFFALKGPNFNANKLAQEAIEKGAIAAVIDDEQYSGEKTTLVPDALTALQALANHHRRQFDIPFIGITGSNGKTTTKELMAAVLSTTYQTHFTKGNLNNHIGVPLTLLEIKKQTEIAIIEMGANHIGEIEELCSIAEPDYGIITNIGKAHLEGFGSLEGVARGKSELYYHVIKNGKNIFVNKHDEHLNRMSTRFSNPITYPGKDDYYHCKLIPGNEFVQVIGASGNTITTHLTGDYNFNNIAAALCVGKFFNVPEKEAEDAIRNYIPANNRSQVEKKGDRTLIMDAYNANPSSMKAALENLNSMKTDNKVAIVGDMLELGNESTMEHSSIGKFLSGSTIQTAIFCGKEMKKAFDSCPKGYYFETTLELIEYLKSTPSFIPEKAAILIKGSRGMKLETIAEVL